MQTMKLPVLNDMVHAVPRIDEKFRPVWEGLSPQHQAALALYFLPHSSNKDVLTPTRPRVIKWYCPFAGQKVFPSGHRYCINVYTGCVHGCVYCYAMSYSPDHASCKHNFTHMVEQDVEDLERFDVPPAPVHLSNSTDPFQPLEAIHHHTQYALQQILAHRKRFTTVTILTKDPLRVVRLGYGDLLRRLVELPPDHPQYERFRQTGQPGFCMEVSLAFLQEEAARAYDVTAPSVAQRIEGLRALAGMGIPLALRIDPLLPRSPLTDDSQLSLADLGLAEGQSLDDLERLVMLAKELKVRHVVYSPMKIVKPRGRTLSPTMQKLKHAYEIMAAPRRLDWRSGSWRLPADVADTRITRPFLEICRRHDVPAKFCMTNLVETP
jgi:DNA repair photolyase